MAYYSKETYERKREYAANIAYDGIHRIAEATGMAEDALDIVAEASSLRHELHSESRKTEVILRGKFNRVGTQYTVDRTLADEINDLHLIDDAFPTIIEPDITDDDSTQDIFDYCDEKIPKDVDDEDELRWLALDLLQSCFDEAVNTWSDSVRAWFAKINEKYGTDFPD